jgi:hypothetical protein
LVALKIIITIFTSLCVPFAGQNALPGSLGGLPQCEQFV